MTKEVATLFIFGVIVFIILFCYFSRYRIAFKNVFGKIPKKADQGLINSEIKGLESSILAYEKRGILKLDELDKERLSFLQVRLERAKELAQRYGFQVPLEQ